MTANEHRKIITSDIKDQLALITFIFIDRNLTNIKVLQDVFESGNGGVSNKIKFFIGKSLLRSVFILHLIDSLFFCLFSKSLLILFE